MYQKHPLEINYHLLYPSGAIKGPVQGALLIANAPPPQD